MHQRCYTSAHQLLAQMPGATVSRLLVMYFARLVKQTCVDLVSRPMSVYGAYSTTFAFAFCEQRLHETGYGGKQLNPHFFYGHFSVNIVMTLKSRIHCDGSLKVAEFPKLA